MGYIEGTINNSSNQTADFLAVLEAEMVAEGWIKDRDEFLDASRGTLKIWRSPGSNHGFSSSSPIYIAMRVRSTTLVHINVCEDIDGDHALGPTYFWGSSPIDSNLRNDPAVVSRTLVGTSYNLNHFFNPEYQFSITPSSFGYWFRVTPDYVMGTVVNAANGRFFGLMDALYPTRPNEFPLGIAHLRWALGQVQHSAAWTRIPGGIPDGPQYSTVGTPNPFVRPVGRLGTPEIDPFHQGYVASRLIINPSTITGSGISGGARLVLPDVVGLNTLDSAVNVGDRVTVDGDPFVYVGRETYMRAS